MACNTTIQKKGDPGAAVRRSQLLNRTTLLLHYVFESTCSISVSLKSDPGKRARTRFQAASRSSAKIVAVARVTDSLRMENVKTCSALCAEASCVLVLIGRSSSVFKIAI